MLRSRSARARALLLSTVVAGAITGGGTATAHATTLLTCPGSQTTTFTPALTSTPQPVAISTQSYYGPCINATNPLELRTGSSSSSSPPAVRSCDDLLGSRSATRTIHWSTSTTSVLSYNITTVDSGLGVFTSTLTGIVSSGEFAGATVAGTNVHYAGVGNLCSTTGTTSNGGVTALTFLQ